MEVLKKRRVTISLHPELEKRIRVLQAGIIEEGSTSISFSNVLNQILIQAFKERIDTRIAQHYTPRTVDLWI